MLWTEIGNVVKIERAGMDGSDRRAVVNSSLGWPGGVAVDAIAERVYWADERLGAIGSATLDGHDIRVKQGKGEALVFLRTLTRHDAFSFFFFRFSRQKRPQTRFLWWCSMTCCTGLMLKNEWCVALIKSLGKTVIFS